MSQHACARRAPKKSVLSIACGLLAAAVLAASVSTADAGHRRHHRHHGDIGAGIVGFAAGAILGSVLAAPRYPYGPGYRGSYRRNYYIGPRAYHPPYAYPMRLAPTYYGRPAPWTPAWYDYCFARYRSFDPRDGTFTAYSGRKKFCH